MSHFDVCIRGGGIVGHTLALLLARERLHVGVVDARPEPSTPAQPDVRVYALNARSRRLLQAVRCWPDAPAVTAVQHMQVWGDAGGTVGFDADGVGVDALTWIVDVPALEARLDQALGYAAQLERLSEPVPATLTVVCEGRGSVSRTALGVSFDTRRYPQTAIAARLRTSQPHEQTARQWFAGSDILAFLPLQGAQGHEVGIVWSVRDADAPQWLAADPSHFCARLQEICAHALGELELISPRKAWPLQSACASRWTGTDAATGQAWVLAGDAAHNVHPLAGQGLNLGLGDVDALVRIIGQRPYWRGVGDRRLLRTYERERRAELAQIDTAMTGLQQLFDLPHAVPTWLRNWGLRGVDALPAVKHWAARQAIGA